MSIGAVTSVVAVIVRLTLAIVASPLVASAQPPHGNTPRIGLLGDAGDPVAERLVASLARPGGNLTGYPQLAWSWSESS